MPSFDSIIVGEDWISEHYFTTDSTKESFQGEVLKLRKTWDEEAKSGHRTVPTRFSQHRGELQVRLAELSETPGKAHETYALLRTSLGFNGGTKAWSSQRSGTETTVDNVWSGAGGETIFLEVEPADSVEDFLGNGKPLGEVTVDGKPDDRSTSKLISELFLGDEAPKYIVAMAGKWLILIEPERWAEGRYLAADVLLVADRNDTKKGQEIDRFLAIFGRDSLLPSAEGTVWWDDIFESSVKHTVGVSKDLREGIRRSIEIIANDVLKRRESLGYPSDEVDGQELAKQSLRFLYRILFLLYAEASPELGVLPIGVGEYNEGYGLDRLRELTLVEIHEDRSLRGTHIYQSLDGLFRLVDQGHTPTNNSTEGGSSSNEGLRFDALKADLFATTATSFINEAKLSNSELQKVLQHLLLSKESRGKDRGFISYAELGINQLGAVYEGLMSYTGFIAETDLHEVAKDGDSSKGSWVVPTERSEAIDSKHFIKQRNDRTGELETVVHPRGAFVFRLAGRERQQSASYYTPEVITKFVVSQALEELLDQDGQKTEADAILKLTVCEPALGSGAFAIEAVRQLAAEYLSRKQEELELRIPADEYPQELQKVKAQIALHQVHGVDLNSTAVELAEVSLWLDTMTSDLQAPWFGMRLKQGNSLVGARRATYSVSAVKAKAYLSEEPQSNPLSGLVEALEADTTDPAVEGRIHHFLLPGEGWGAAADAKEVKDIVPQEQNDLKAWAKSTRLALKKTQIDRLVALSERVEVLWKVALRRLQIAESKAARFVDYWPHERPEHTVSVSREEIETALADSRGAYQRLKRVMNAWNALWFWPLTETNVTPPSIEEWINGLEGILGRPYSPTSKAPKKFGHTDGQISALSSAGWADLKTFETFDYPLSGMIDAQELSEEYRWLAVCDRIAGEELPAFEGSQEGRAQSAFFHWELEFASVFGRGGFDMQVGNPPWVRPRSDEAALLAEHDAWWQLSEKPTQAMVRQKREQTLALPGARDSFVDAAVPTSVLATFLGASSQYSVLKGLQPDLYRAFMARTWRNTSPTGTIALIHPESHFTEKKAHHLRAETYRRLRRHWQFRNAMLLFEVHDGVFYGVHIYGKRQEEPQFQMAASLYHPDTVERSLKHEGGTEVPGLKTVDGHWDTRPHPERIVHVDLDVLRVWADILDEPGTPPLHARMVYPINRASMNVLEKLSKAPRVRELGLQYSSGWHETGDRKKGYFEVGSKVNDSWDDVILQGPHFTVANPFYKEPNPTMKSNQDYTELDLEALPADFIPRTSYQPVRDGSVNYDADYTHWEFDKVKSSARSHYRIGWRLMAATTGVRTFYPNVLPPGAAHVNGIISGYGTVFEDSETMLECVGQWGTIVVDFLAKAGSLGHFYGSVVEGLPAKLGGPLREQIARTSAGLVCLTEAYEPLWNDVMGTPWTTESPVRIAAQRRQLQVELDALAALSLGLTPDELCTIYRTQFPVLRGYEQSDLYDANGRKVPGEINKLYRQRGEILNVEERSWTHPQSGVEYVFEFPFRGFDREEDMRAAYAHFERLLAEKQIEELAK
ncbi:DNA methyltransferase [Glutamicibacter ardleyensis]|uniref:DNA methyltransferase n=1 Tax=Glutamicibacter ardleyensis TaxID=225894 RepID=UPI003FD24BD9